MYTVTSQLTNAVLHEYFDVRSHFKNTAIVLVFYACIVTFLCASGTNDCNTATTNNNNSINNNNNNKA